MATAKKTAPYRTIDVVRFDGDDLEVGSIIELTDAQAQQLIDCGAVVPQSAVEPKAKK